MSTYSPVSPRKKGLSWTTGVKLITVAISVVVSIWIIYYAHDNIIPRRKHANIVIGTGLAVYYFTHAVKAVEIDNVEWKDHLKAIVFLAFGVAGLLVGLYVHVHFERWQQAGRLMIYNDADLLVGAYVMFAVTHLTFREFGRVLGGVILVSIVYAYFGPQLPGIFAHSGLSVEEIIVRQSVLLTGVYGFLMQVGATWIAIFLIFAGLVKGFDGFDYIIDLSARLQEYSISGVAQMAVVASSIMGTMLGSSAANVATTGSFTIPTMEDSGLSPKFSAAVESSASTGGQILPPIMGAAAFLMADILGIPFAQVAIAGILPAFLFYLTVALGIHLTIGKRGWFDEDEAADRGEAVASPEAESDEAMGSSDPERADAGGASFNWRTVNWTFVLRGMQYAVPLVVLIYYLMVAQFGPMRSGLYTIIALFIMRVLTLTFLGKPQQIVPDTVSGFSEGFGNLAAFVGILGSLGIVIDLVSFTGFAQRISLSMVLISGGIFVVTLVLVMVTSLLFGLGMPTPAAYVLVATIIAPTLMAHGVTDLTAHMFVFYFALLSAITPPVAVAVAIAVGISGSDFIETCIETLRLCGIGFLIPFIFIANPELIHWSAPQTAISAVLISIACVALILGSVGYNGSHRLTKVDRVIYLTLFVAVAFGPNLSVQIVGTLVFLLLARRSPSRVFDISRSVPIR